MQGHNSITDSPTLTPPLISDDARLPVHNPEITRDLPHFRRGAQYGSTRTETCITAALGKRTEQMKTVSSTVVFDTNDIETETAFWVALIGGEVDEEDLRRPALARHPGKR